jgi:hypothetical protein
MMSRRKCRVFSAERNYAKRITTRSFIQSSSHHVQSHFRSMQSSREKCPVDFRVRSHPPIFVPQQETLKLYEKDGLAESILRNGKWKVRWCYVWGIWRMRGKSDLTLRQRVENDFGSVAPGIVGVNDESAFACCNQSVTDRS